jgi:DNA modification methylase
MTYNLLKGNNLELLPTLADNSIDSIVTDPPYGLGNPDPDYIIKAIQLWASGDRSHIPEGKGFMGKSWDAFVPPPAVWDECFRVLKPGGHLLAFAGTRTYDLMGISIRMAGFEIRDSIGWVYGSGFPKSLNIAKNIDKAMGVESEVVGTRLAQGSARKIKGTNSAANKIPNSGSLEFDETVIEITKPTSLEAQQWQGWGTALKPALEPIVVARKPLIGTVAENVLTYETGGLNIDASRIGTQVMGGGSMPAMASGDSIVGRNQGAERKENTNTATGRWPANLILDEYTAELLDEQSGQTKSPAPYQQASKSVGMYGAEKHHDRPSTHHGDSGGASRFFYVAKASKRDRNEGLEELPDHEWRDDGAAIPQRNDRPFLPSKNHHPTVKPTDLMRYLVKLVTPPGGTVLDPFTGSGSTGKAAILEGFDFIGIELTEDYWPIIEGRLKHAEAKVAERIKEAADQEQEKLF